MSASVDSTLPEDARDESHEGSTGKVKDAEEVTEEDHFGSRWSYWLAAIGCAVGFGNVWRFPYLIYDYGGAAFFVPYLICLLGIVLPVAQQEYGIGQITQSGLMTAFCSVDARAAGAGWGFVLSFNICNFYPLLMCWSAIFMIHSCSNPLPWMVTEQEEIICESAPNQPVCESNELCWWMNSTSNPDHWSCSAAVVNKAEMFFLEYCNINEDYHAGVAAWSWAIFTGFLVAWGLAFLALFKGARVLGYLTYVTMTLPCIFMLILLIVGCTLPGAWTGIEQYILKFDWSIITQGDVWISALGQAIFSMGAVQGTMAGYAAHNRKDQNFVQDTYVVFAGDFLFAFIAGFAVFSVTGYLAEDAGVEMDDLPLSGTGLVFQTYPVGLGTLSYPWGQILNFCFFLTMWLLGFTTIVGLAESVILTLLCSRFISHYKHARLAVVGILCLILFCVSMIYCTDQGKNIFDCFDYFNADIAAVFVLWLHSLVSCTWVNAAYNRMEIGKVSWYTWALGFHCTYIIITIVSSVVGGDAGVWIWIGGVFGICILCWVVAVIMTKSTDEEGNKIGWVERMKLLTFKPTDDYRRVLNAAIKTEPCSSCGCCQHQWCATMWLMPRLWTLIMSLIVPPICMLFWMLALFDPDGVYKTPEADNPYPWWIFLLGSFLPWLVVILGICGTIWPPFSSWLLPTVEDRPQLTLHSPHAAQEKKVDLDADTVSETAAVSDAVEED